MQLYAFQLIDIYFVLHLVKGSKTIRQILDSEFFTANVHFTVSRVRKNGFYKVVSFVHCNSQTKNYILNLISSRTNKILEKYSIIFFKKTN